MAFGIRLEGNLGNYSGNLKFVSVLGVLKGTDVTGKFEDMWCLVARNTRPCSGR